MRRHSYPVLDFLCQNGFKHYMITNRGSYADALAEAFGKYLGREVYDNNAAVLA